MSHKEKLMHKHVKTFNMKMMKHMKAFDNLSVVSLENARELYTSQGLHLNGKGKERMADKIAKIFDDIINMKQ
jgi:lysophospholipase L1-like esterase